MGTWEGGEGFAILHRIRDLLQSVYASNCGHKRREEKEKNEEGPLSTLNRGDYDKRELTPTGGGIGKRTREDETRNPRKPSSGLSH